MEKLIELLNEYAHTYADHYDDTGEEIEIKFLEHTDNCFIYYCDGKFDGLVDDTVISKRFEFIKRLVENDKIDIRKAKYYSDLIYYQDYGEGSWACKDYEFVIMLLSISDTPIEDLCGYLKDDATEKVDTLLKGLKKSCESLGL